MTSEMQLAAFHASGALERPVHHPLGDIAGREFLEFRIFDITLHAWDLASALGTDETIDPELVQAVLAIVESNWHGLRYFCARNRRRGFATAGEAPRSDRSADELEKPSPLDGDAVVGEPCDRTLEDADRRGCRLVGVELGVGDSGVVVDHGVDVGSTD